MGNLIIRAEKIIFYKKKNLNDDSDQIVKFIQIKT